MQRLQYLYIHRNFCIRFLELHHRSDLHRCSCHCSDLRRWPVAHRGGRSDLVIEEDETWSFRVRSSCSSSTVSATFTSTARRGYQLSTCSGRRSTRWQAARVCTTTLRSRETCGWASSTTSCRGRLCSVVRYCWSTATWSSSAPKRQKRRRKTRESCSMRCKTCSKRRRSTCFNQEGIRCRLRCV